MYHLHKKYSKAYGYGEGLIGPPYVIYKITPTNTTQIYYGNGRTTGFIEVKPGSYLIIDHGSENETL
jgi:hypothetical protein